MHFIDIDEGSSAPLEHDEAAAGAATIEAQEAANQHLYEGALALQLAGDSTGAVAAFEELLRQELIAGAEDVPTAADEGREHGLDGTAQQPHRPSLQLKYLALRNLAELEVAAGAHQSALRRLLEAVRIREGDAVLWQRLGAVARHTGLPHLARYALEQAVATSPHLQLAHVRLQELLSTRCSTSSPSPSPSRSRSPRCGCRSY